MTTPWARCVTRHSTSFNPARCGDLSGRHRNLDRSTTRRSTGCASAPAHPTSPPRCAPAAGAGGRRTAQRLDQRPRIGGYRICSTRWAPDIPSVSSSILPERVITAAGVSSVIDMGIAAAELLVSRAEASQLMIEYDPQLLRWMPASPRLPVTHRLALEFYQHRL